MAPCGATVLRQYGTGTRGGDPDEEGRKALMQPRGLSLAADGSLLVADFAAHCVFQFKSSGDVKGRVVAGQEGRCLPTVDPLKDIDRPLGAPEGEGFLLKRPVDVSADSIGGVYVLDSEDCRVQRFATSSGSGAATVTIPPPGAPPQKSIHTPEAIKNPRTMLTAPDGGIVVVDSWSHRVLRFAPPGSDDASKKPEVLAGAANSYGASADKLYFPSCAAFDLDGNLLVADTNNHRVQCFAPGETMGKTIAGSADGKRGSGPGELDMPTGLCVDPRDGSVLIADRCNARLLRLPGGSSAGNSAEVILGPDSLSRPWGLCINEGGELFVSDERRSVVLRLELEPLAVAPRPPAPSAPVAPAAPPPTMAVQASAAAKPVAAKPEAAPAAAFAPPPRSAVVDNMGLD